MMSNPTKIPKLDCDFESTSKITSFANFKVNEVINDNQKRKLLIVTGRFGEADDMAVVLMEKQPFSKDAQEMLFSKTTKVENVFTNDIYSSFIAYPPKEISALKSTIIYPATQKHIEKYTSQEMFLVTETYNDYISITLPYIEEKQFNLQWVYNILDGKAERDRVFFRDDDPDVGFVLVPDMKWNSEDVSSLYVSAIVQKRGLKSLRDLDGDSLPLLRNIYHHGTAAIEKKYGLDKAKLRVYFHYQPSYYHLHVHFTHVAFEEPSASIDRGRLLLDVISNIELVADYYAKVPLTFCLKANDQLLKKLSNTSQQADH